MDELRVADLGLPLATPFHDLYRLWSWEEALHAQQRVMSECLQSHQLWLSWWVSSLPSMDWSHMESPLPLPDGTPRR
ncbi:hypothetical protein C7444_11243 [Sphaerotilus hippei]|uniref:Uncharacterized protein n=1 Tax=Sphaerotilus hippei TaxID=744406 RepID=A0A318GYA8_9BURK|nr:hypothetical protein [Sphaerotilus hippei]PXW94728.1 hypothetical protein C7444_11243 [Sphaerotilus hippei]